jgi:hypothetical protein
MIAILALAAVAMAQTDGRDERAVRQTVQPFYAESFSQTLG